MKAVVPGSQLLVYRTGEGWERLCQFLGAPVPPTPFPHENRAGQAGNITEKYFKFDIFQQVETEVRRSLITILALSVSATIIAGWIIKKSLRLHIK